MKVSSVLWVLALGCGSRSSVSSEALGGDDGSAVAGCGGASSSGSATDGSIATSAGGLGGNGSGGGSTDGGSGGGLGSGGFAGTPEPCVGDGESVLGPRLVCVDGGTFTLGDPAVATNPREGVEVHSFWLDETEVTIAQYRECVTNNVCTLPGQGLDCNWTSDPSELDSHPINCVDLTQAERFCESADKRIPSADEWEFAARGPGRSPRVYPWGDEEPLDQLCWNRTAGTCPVASFERGRTTEGIYDLAGNVREFTSTCAGMGDLGCLYPAPGGSWVTTTDSTFRAGNPWNLLLATHSTRVTGFRCAR